MVSLNTQVLNYEFEQMLTEEVNREATLLSLLSKRPERKATCQWIVNVGGAKAKGTPISGSTPNASRDTNVPAQLPIHYNSLQSSFTLNAKEVEEAAVQVSEPELRDLLRSYMKGAVEEMARSMNENLFVGKGDVEDGGIFGLQKAVSEDDYAGLSPKAYPLWKAVILDLGLDNEGNFKDWDNFEALSQKRLFEIERRIRQKGGKYDFIVTSPKVMEQYKRLFATERTFFVNTTSGEQGNVPLVDLGFGVGGFSGVPIIDDPHCYRVRDDEERAAIAANSSGLNNASDVPEVDEGVMYFMRKDDLVFKSVPTGENYTFSMNGTYTQMEKLAKTKLYIDEYAVGCIPQMELHSRKNCGRIQNIELISGVNI